MFTLTGCLGMAGLGQSGVAVTINNLSSHRRAGRGGVAGGRPQRCSPAPTPAAPTRCCAHAAAVGAPLHDRRWQRLLRGRVQRRAQGAHADRRAGGPPAHQPLLRSGAAHARARAGRQHHVRPSRHGQRPCTSSSARATRRDVGAARQPRGLSAQHLLASSTSSTGDPSSSKTCGRLLMEPSAGRMRVAAGLQLERRSPRRSAASARWRALISCARVSEPARRPIAGANDCRVGSGRGARRRWSIGSTIGSGIFRTPADIA